VCVCVCVCSEDRECALTFMACPKQPLPRTSPWIRSEALNIRCVWLDMTRSDSERLMSFFRDSGDGVLLEHGDLSILQLRLCKHTHRRVKISLR